MSHEQDYFCNCTRYCITFQKVSRRTFYAHAQYRRTDTHSALDNYLHQHNIDPGPVHLAPDPVDHDLDDEQDRALDAEEVPHNIPALYDEIEDLYADPLPLQPAQADMDVSDEDEDNTVRCSQSNPYSEH